MIVLTINLFYVKYVITRPVDSPPLRIDLSDYGVNYAPYDVIGDSYLINSTVDHYKNKLLEYKQTIPFDLSDTSLLDYCSESRNNIDTYLDCIGRISYKALNKEHFVSTEFRYFDKDERNPFNDLMKIIGHFNNQAYHVPALVLNLITNSLLKHYTNSSDSSITVINRPLPKNMTESISDSANKNMNNFRIASGLNFGLSFLLASFAVFLIKENVSGAKHIQFLKGCNPILFWISELIWDMFNYIISISFVLAILFVI